MLGEGRVQCRLVRGAEISSKLRDALANLVGEAGSSWRYAGGSWGAELALLHAGDFLNFSPLQQLDSHGSVGLQSSEPVPRRARTTSGEMLHIQFFVL